MKFYSLDLDLDPLILVFKLDLNIIKMYICAKNEDPTFNGSKVITSTDWQTDRQTQLKLLPTAYTDGIYVQE